ncbi:hypothetical protein D3C76_1318740 [compost metagenome]
MEPPEPTQPRRSPAPRRYGINDSYDLNVKHLISGDDADFKKRRSRRPTIPGLSEILATSTNTLPAS